MSDDLTTAHLLGAEQMRDKLHKQADEIERLRAENETLRRDVRTAIMGDSAELQDVKRENEKLREALKPFAVDSLMDNAPTLADYRGARKALESGDE